MASLLRARLCYLCKVRGRMEPHPQVGVLGKIVSESIIFPGLLGVTQRVCAPFLLLTGTDYFLQCYMILPPPCLFYSYLLFERLMGHYYLPIVTALVMHLSSPTQTKVDRNLVLKKFFLKEGLWSPL